MSGPLDISLKDKLLFIESLLIPSFNPTNKLDTPEKREEWMRQRAINTHWDAGISEELIIRYGTVKSLDEAERKLEKAERLLEKAEENERKQGKTKHHPFTFIVFTLFLSFSVYCHLVFSHVVNLVSYLLLLFFRCTACC
jgi:hypothetical protein